MQQRTGFLDYDGRRVAYASVGEGRPLVVPGFWVSHVVEDWGRPVFRRFLEALARERRVIRYDRPGTGLSDRERPPSTLTLEYEVGLLELLVDRLGLERIQLLAISSGGPVAAVFATRRPEQVDRLVFYGSFAAGTELADARSREAMVALVRSHWGLGSRMLADIFGPNATPAERRELAAIQRSAATPEAAADLLELMYAYDVRELLPALAVPTLVVHREGDRAIPARNGREVAALVPGAELRILSGDAHPPWHGDGDELLAAVAPFLGFRPPAREAQPADVEELTVREREVLRLVADGLSDGEIAARLVLSPHTVHRHVANIRRKLGLHSRSAAAAHAARAGLV